jgi:2-hydroxychromene-2-carboxylate isomerase
MPTVEFWYEFASTYSYPAAMRVEALAAERGIGLRWRPFLLAPIFAEAGWRDSPFNIYPVKGRYMWRDMERLCEAMGLPLTRPNPFPQNSLLAARIALALAGDARVAFSRGVFHAEFGEGRSISDRGVLSGVLLAIGSDPEAVLARAEDGGNKERLKAESAEAKSLGLPGAPCLRTADGEIFWGNDRLESGLDWASRRATAPRTA